MAVIRLSIRLHRCPDELERLGDVFFDDGEIVAPLPVIELVQRS
jgi:hypothetical protein